jgi:ATP-binding cassette subfamily C protein LapB
LAAHHGRAISRDALLAGLPITDDRLSASLFGRAAARANLEAEAQRRRLSDIPAIVLPAVLTMRDGSTRILLAVDHKAKTATILNPSLSDPPETRKLRELSKEYLGYLFLVRPAELTNPRAIAAGDVPRRHWFWSVVRRFWKTTRTSQSRRW